MSYHIIIIIIIIWFFFCSGSCMHFNYYLYLKVTYRYDLNFLYQLLLNHSACIQNILYYYKE